MSTPARFEPLFRTGPFTDLIGPLYGKGKRQDLEMGMRVEDKHGNARASTVCLVIGSMEQKYRTDGTRGILTSFVSRIFFL